jgi:benzoylformate decarboxylase
MRGREVLLESLKIHGVEVIFGNPGPTESPLLDGLIEYPDLRYIMALHESVVVAAANCYAQASGKTAVVNLHAAPGLGNALGMLFCAHKARSPMVVTAGQQDVRMRLREPILQHDLVGMAAPVTKWSVQIERASEVGPILRRAFKIAQEEPRGPVFIALPIDVMEAETDIAATVAGPIYAATAADPVGIAAAAKLVLAASHPVIIAGDDAALGDASPSVVNLAERTGAAVWVEPLRNQASFPTSHVLAQGGLPLNAGDMRRLLADADLIILIGGRAPEELWFEDGPCFPIGAKVVQIEAAPSCVAFSFPVDVGLVGDIARTAVELSERIEATALAAYTAAATSRCDAWAEARAVRQAKLEADICTQLTEGHMTSLAALSVIRRALPPCTVVVEESSTTRADVVRTLPFAPGDYFSGRGGGIGQGLPGGIGAKLAFPDRPVVVLSGDGSGMFGIQALWTAAHHDLDVVFLIFANREYRVLKQNIDEYRKRFRAPTDRPYPHMDLSQPDLDFVNLAQGMGVAACRVEDVDSLGDTLARAFAAKSPYLIEMIVA